jgi:hypothetical protein
LLEQRDVLVCVGSEASQARDPILVFLYAVEVDQLRDLIGDRHALAMREREQAGLERVDFDAIAILALEEVVIELLGGWQRGARDAGKVARTLRSARGCARARRRLSSGVIPGSPRWPRGILRQIAPRLNRTGRADR